jgi:hypothetical protein
VTEAAVRNWAAGTRPVSRPYQPMIRKIMDGAK